MNEIEAALRRLSRDLRELDIRWALVGGLAVSVRGAPRFTNDIDVAVITDSDKAAEALSFALRTRGYAPMFSVEDERSGRLMTERFGSPGPAGADLLIDLLFASTGIEPEIVGAAEPISVFRGLTLPVATRTHLIAMKVLAANPNRPRDTEDLERLIADASDEEIERSRAALELIARRGFDRDRELGTALEAIVTAVRSRR